MANPERQKKIEFSKNDRGFRIKFWILWFWWNFRLLINSKQPSVLFHLGNALAAQGRREQAIAKWKIAFTLDPNHRKVRHNLITGLLAEKRADEALALLNRVWSDSPKDSALYKLLGSAQQEAGQLTKALLTYHEWCAKEPTSFEAASTYGIALIKAGQLSAAIGYLEHAKKLNPANQACLAALKIAYAKSNGQSQHSNVI